MALEEDIGATRALRLMRLLRAGILGTCTITAAVACLHGATTLAGLAVVIAIEETWETSVVVAALRRQLDGTPVPRHRHERT